MKGKSEWEAKDCFPAMECSEKYALMGGGKPRALVQPSIMEPKTLSHRLRREGNRTPQISPISPGTKKDDTRAPALEKKGHLKGGPFTECQRKGPKKSRKESRKGGGGKRGFVFQSRIRIQENGISWGKRVKKLGKRNG